MRCRKELHYMQGIKWLPQVELINLSITVSSLGKDNQYFTQDEFTGQETSWTECSQDIICKTLLTATVIVYLFLKHIEEHLNSFR